MDKRDDFDAFYTASARRVVHHVYAVCGDLAEAQDVTQEAYVRAWQKWPTLSGYDDPESWVRMVAWRLAANRWRGLRRWFAARPRLGLPQPAPGPTPDRVALVDTMRQLPEPQRRVIVLHYLYDMPVTEVARNTGMPVGTVKVYLARARTALATLLTTETETADVIARS